MSSDDLGERVTRLEVRLDTLTTDLRRHIEMQSEVQSLLSDHLRRIDGNLDDHAATRSRQMGFLSGVVAAVSAMWVLLIAVWNFARDVIKA